MPGPGGMGGSSGGFGGPGRGGGPGGGPGPGRGGGPRRGPGPGRMGGFGGHRPPPPPPPPRMGYRRRRVFGWGRPWVGYGPGGGCCGCVLPVLVGGLLLLAGVAALIAALL